MATTDASRTTLAYGIEASPNTEPTTTFYLGPNSFPEFGPQPERIAHSPIDPNPGPEAGVSIGTTVPVGVEVDLTRDHWLASLEFGFFRTALSTTPRIFYPTSVRSTDYVVAANGALVENTLIIVRGCATAANNGLKVVGAGSDATHIVASGLTAETFTSGQGVTIEVCGFQFATGDAEIDASGRFKTTAKDLTELGLEVGQTIFIGDSSSSAYKFATAAHRGQARVTIIAAGLLTLDNVTSGTFPSASADNGSGKTIRLFYGRTLRVRPTTHASYAERTAQFEIAHPTLSAGSPAYEYMVGCGPVSCRYSFPVRAKATFSGTFTGNSAVTPTASRRSGFNPPLARVAKQMLHTGSHIRRGRIRSGSTDLTGYITAADFNIATGIQRNDAHGSDGSVLFTYGDITIEVSASVFFSSMDLIASLVSDATCNADWFMRSGPTDSSTTDTWGLALDIPSLQMTAVPRGIEVGKPTVANIAFRAVRDTTYSTWLIVSDFPYLPAP